MPENEPSCHRPTPDRQSDDYGRWAVLTSIVSGLLLLTGIPAICGGLFLGPPGYLIYGLVFTIVGLACGGVAVWLAIQAFED